MNIDKLLERAERAAANQDWTTVLDCARRLQMARHPEGYYYQALALEKTGQIDAAVSVLQKGVRQLPRDFDLRQDLIYMLKQAGRYEEALQVADEALQSPFIEPHNILQISTQKVHILNLLQRYAESLQVIEQALERLRPTLQTLADIALYPGKVETLIQSGDYEGVRATLQNEVEPLCAASELAEHTLRPFIYSTQARILLNEKQDVEGARHMAQDALKIHRIHEPALTLLYSTNPPEQGKLGLYLVQVGSFVEDEFGEQVPRLTAYTVVARDETHAEQLALEFESDALPDTTQVFEVRQIGEREDAPAGVLTAMEEFLDIDEFEDLFEDEEAYER